VPETGDVNGHSSLKFIDGSGDREGYVMTSKNDRGIYLPLRFSQQWPGAAISTAASL
jgi:hypothetical protein